MTNDKISKGKSGYVDAQEYEGQQPCKDCTMFRSASNTCTLVKGYIEPDAHCDYFEEKR